MEHTGSQLHDMSVHGMPHFSHQRYNHNGNSEGDEPAHYMWTIPENLHKDGAKCVIRLRYNITTYDFSDHWNTFSDKNGDSSPVKNNPSKDWIGFGPNVTGPLRLAIDTSQFGRTFQDRTHIFQIRKRPEDLNCGGILCSIVNVNVRGRRGNIVQTYPAVEYDFVPPGKIGVAKNDYLHIQWTGADSNAQGNAGQGRAGTDRVFSSFNKRVEQYGGSKEPR